MSSHSVTDSTGPDSTSRLKRRPHELERLCRAWVDIVYKWCERMLGGDYHDSWDATQETFLKVIRTNQARGIDFWKTYLWLAAKTTAVDIVRGRNRRPVAIPQPELLPAPSRADTSPLDELREALAKISDPKDREIIDRFCDGMSDRAIGEEMEFSREGINRRKRRAFGRLASEIRRAQDESESKGR